MKETFVGSLSGAASGCVLGIAFELSKKDADWESVLRGGWNGCWQGWALGTIDGLGSGFQHRAILVREAKLQETKPTNSLKPLENHHFATNKNRRYTPEMEAIASRYDLDLNGGWNMGQLPHKGRHPNAYHEWVLRNMRQISNTPSMNQVKFIHQFRQQVIIPVKNNPEMLYKKYWE